MSRSPRSAATRVAFAALTVAAIWLAARDIVAQWQEFRASGSPFQLEWGPIAGSCLVVLLAYGILIETWRHTVTAWGEHLSRGDAAQIWFISNLGRYVPGKVWQLGAMSAMAHQRGVSAVAAAGSALIVNLVNLLAGVGVAAVAGAEFLQARSAALVLAALLVLAILATPWVVPLVGRAAGILLRRRVDMPRLPQSALWVAAIGCVSAWLLYGVAFWLFVKGTLGTAPGSVASYVAVFTASYLVGYIAVFAPGGIGVREKSLVASLSRLSLPPGAPGIVALGSRLWLTVLEVVPGVVLLALGAWRRGRPHPSENGGTPD